MAGKHTDLHKYSKPYTYQHAFEYAYADFDSYCTVYFHCNPDSNKNDHAHQHTYTHADLNTNHRSHNSVRLQPDYSWRNHKIRRCNEHDDYQPIQFHPGNQGCHGYMER